jgi:hypothetical protein
MEVFIKSALALLLALEPRGICITIIIISGAVVYGYLGVLTKRAEVMPDLIRAQGEMAESIARADAIRARAHMADTTLITNGVPKKE